MQRLLAEMVQKMFRIFLQTSVILVLLNVGRCDNVQDEKYWFVEQPPSTLHCSPHRRLTIVCRVEGPPRKFSIMWLRKHADEGAMDVRSSVTRATVHQTNSNYTTSVGLAEFVRVASRLSISPVSEEDVGQYWCQVLLGNGTLLTGKSNILTLEKEETYNLFLPCKGVNSIIRRDCVMNSGPISTLPSTQATFTFQEETQLPTIDISRIIPFTNTTISKPVAVIPPKSNSLAAAYSTPTVVLAVCIVTIILILFTILLRMKYCRGASQVDPHYNEDIEPIQSMVKATSDKQTTSSECNTTSKV